MFPALVAGFVTTKPPGKPQSPKVVVILIKICFKQHEQKECFIDSLFPKEGGTCNKLFWGKNLIDKEKQVTKENVPLILLLNAYVYK